MAGAARRTAILASLAWNLFASGLTAEILATGPAHHITLFPEGAEVTRLVRADLAAGQNSLIVTGLPSGLIAESIRLSLPKGVSLGAFALREARLRPAEPPPAPERIAAEAAVEAARSALQAAQMALDLAGAEVEAAEARAGFAAALRADGRGLTAEAFRQLAAALGQEIAAARSAAIRARAELPPLEQRRDAAAEELARAEAARDALPRPAEDAAELVIRLEAAASGPQEIRLTHFLSEAGWTPVNDWHLVTGPEPRLTLERAALIHQSSGEDWSAVGLTLSTAQPGNQASPTPLWPILRQLQDPAENSPLARMTEAGAPVALESEAPADAAAPQASFQGDIVTYAYPAPADVASGVENLRLGLGQVEFTPNLQALAVPAWDRTAFAVAELTNTSGQIILPGQAFLYRDGNFMGVEWREQIAAGQTDSIAFGALDQIRLTAEMPRAEEGEKGLLTSSNARSEEVLYRVENLGAVDWPLRLMAQVPVSEHQDLVITWSADPPPDEADVKGQRGILAWTLPLPAGSSQTVRLRHEMTWPQDRALQ